MHWQSRVQLLLHFERQLLYCASSGARLSSDLEQCGLISHHPEVSTTVDSGRKGYARRDLDGGENRDKEQVVVDHARSNYEKIQATEVRRRWCGPLAVESVVIFEVISTTVPIRMAARVYERPINQFFDQQLLQN